GTVVSSKILPSGIEATTLTLIVASPAVVRRTQTLSPSATVVTAAWVVQLRTSAPVALMSAVGAPTSSTVYGPSCSPAGPLRVFGVRPSLGAGGWGTVLTSASATMAAVRLISVEPADGSRVKPSEKCQMAAWMADAWLLLVVALPPYLFK